MGIPLALFVTWFAMVQYQDWRYIHPWERVARGDTEEHVVALLARPHRVINEHSDKGLGGRTRASSTTTPSP
jgi:hypothetical protein